MPESEAVEEKSMPKMASDARRLWVTSLLAVIPGALYGLIGFGLGSDATADIRIVSGVLVYWFFTGLCYLILTTRTFSGAPTGMLAHWLRETTPRTPASRFWLWLSGGSGISYATQAAVLAVLIVLTLSFTPEFRAAPGIMIAGISAVVGSWLLIVASFAVEYARTNTDVEGLVFPGEKIPLFSDYLYLAVQVSTSYSSADVTTVAPGMRRTITIHSVIAFAFNTVIIAILVSALISTAS